MTSEYETGRRRFYRDRENGKIFGVCAGVADYFGFDLRMTRVLAVIALIMAAPGVILLYCGVALLAPVAPGQKKRSAPKHERFRHSLRASPRATVTDVKRRLLRMDARLARMERHVTSPRYNLDRELRDL